MVYLKSCGASLFSIFLSVIIVHGKRSDVSGRNYSLMPDLFHLDDYDKCMLLDEDALYCTFTFHLSPINETVLWSIIQNVSAVPKNYRHDKLRHGICVPTTCASTFSRAEELSVDAIIETCYNQKFSSFQLKGNVTNVKCETKDSGYQIDVYDITFGVLFMFYFTFVLIASCYEGIARYQKKEVYTTITGSLGGKLISAFSIPKNWYRLTATNNNADAKKLRGIQGMRVYNMMCVILCHTVMTHLAFPISNTKYVENLTDNPLNMFIANGHYAVQTFFVISGWLLAFHFFQMLEEKKNVKFVYFVMAFFNRYIRLTPVLAVAVAFESTWFIHFGRGPNWDFAVGEDYRNCKKNWWTNFLYVNNYVDNEHMCLHQTWYIASDTQLYILSLALLWLMWKNPTKIKLILSSTIIFGLILQGSIAYFKDYEIVIRQYPEIIYDLKVLRLPVWRDLYSSGHSNIVGYAIGLTFGYMFYKHRNKVVTVKKIHVVLWWFLTFGLCIFVVLIAAVMYSPNYESSKIESALYWAFGKNLFALGIAIGIMGFTLKIGWFVRWFCEWKAVSILGRLTYSTYIIHVTLLRMKAGYRRQPLYVNDYLIFTEVLGDIVLSYLAGTVVCLLFEMPVSALQKLIMPQMDNKRLKGSNEKSLQKLEYDECNAELNNCVNSKL